MSHIHALLRPAESRGSLAGMDPAAGAAVHMDRRCPGCRRVVDEGDPIVRHEGQWLHATCLSEFLREMNTVDAWLVIAGQLANRPRGYSVTETRTIVNQLIRIAGGLPMLPFPAWLESVD